jgi:hypothetical protein
MKIYRIRNPETGLFPLGTQVFRSLSAIKGYITQRSRWGRVPWLEGCEVQEYDLDALQPTVISVESLQAR